MIIDEEAVGPSDLLGLHFGSSETENYWHLNKFDDFLKLICFDFLRLKFKSQNEVIELLLQYNFDF